MKFSVHRLDDSRRADFFKVHSEKYDHGWCFCTAWWTESWKGWLDRTADDNLKLRNAVFEREDYDGYLLYADDRPIGWCQCLQRDRLEKLRVSYKLDEDPDAWAITCFFIIPEYREMGLAHYFLAAILCDLKSKKVKYVQAFPRRGAGLPASEVWTGPETLFVKAGFERSCDHPAYPVYCMNFDKVRC